MPVNYQLAKIYTIANNVNNIIYVGSTAQGALALRMGGHRRDAADIKNTSPFYTAMRTIGIQNFRIILHHAFLCNSKDELEAEEYKTLNEIIAAGVTVYNSMINGKQSDATKAKMSRKRSPETKAKMSVAQFKFGCISYREKNHKWQFQWKENQTKQMKSFACRKHGYWNAKLLCEDERKRVYPEWKCDEDIATNELMSIDI